jgi:hypothetical protein
MDAGDELLAPRMKRLFLKAIALQRRRHTLAASTVGSIALNCAAHCGKS